MPLNLKKILIGSPISEEHMEHQKIGKAKALAVLPSDALSSVAYASEEILIPLMAFSAAAGVVLIVIAFTKFLSGAWMVILLIPYMVFVFSRIKNHYVQTAKQLDQQNCTFLPGEIDHMTLIPISGLHPGVMDAIAYAKTISQNITLCYVEINKKASEQMVNQCKNLDASIKLVILPSPFRSVISPMLDYVDKLRLESPRRMITVIIPEFITSRWYHNFLHNQTALWLMAFLRNKKRVIVTSVRYHLE